MLLISYERMSDRKMLVEKITIWRPPNFSSKSKAVNAILLKYLPSLLRLNSKTAIGLDPSIEYHLYKLSKPTIVCT